MNLNRIEYDINAVIEQLAAKIANLEAQLAVTQAVNDAYAIRIQELENKEKNAE